MVDFLLPWEIIPIVPVNTVTPCPTCPTSSMTGTGTGITIDDQVIIILIALVVGYLIHEVL